MFSTRKGRGESPVKVKNMKAIIFGIVALLFCVLYFTFKHIDEDDVPTQYMKWIERVKRENPPDKANEIIEQMGDMVFKRIMDDYNRKVK